MTTSVAPRTTARRRVLGAGVIVAVIYACGGAVDDLPGWGPCAAHGDAATCRNDQVCRWLGAYVRETCAPWESASSPDVPLTASGCFPVSDCHGDADCGARGRCLTLTYANFQYLPKGSPCRTAALCVVR